MFLSEHWTVLKHGLTVVEAGMRRELGEGDVGKEGDLSRFGDSKRRNFEFEVDKKNYFQNLTFKNEYPKKYNGEEVKQNK